MTLAVTPYHEASTAPTHRYAAPRFDPLTAESLLTADSVHAKTSDGGTTLMLAIANDMHRLDYIKADVKRSKWRSAKRVVDMMSRINSMTPMQRQAYLSLVAHHLQSLRRVVHVYRHAAMQTPASRDQAVAEFLAAFQKVPKAMQSDLKISTNLTLDRFHWPRDEHAKVETSQ